MNFIVAAITFASAAVLTSYVASRISGQTRLIVELLIVLLGFFGVVTALAQLASDARVNRINGLSTRANDSFYSLLSATEWRMNDCGVWWGDILNQTNRPPAACLDPDPRYEGGTCREVCRAGHLITQRGRYAVEPDAQQERARHLTGICIEGNEEQLRSICSGISKYQEDVDALAVFQDDAGIEIALSSPSVLLVAQLLITLALGLQVGMIIGRLLDRRRPGAATPE